MNLAAGIKEMRSVAQRLMAWADDLEKNSAEAEKTAEPAAAPEPAASVPSVPSRTELKGFLAKLCAAGYSAQVKALIASYGAASLSGVPEEALGDLWNAALLIGPEEEEGENNAG